MNCSKKTSDIPDFRREDDIWVRTAEEKGTVLLESFLTQTDQDNADERKTIIQRLAFHFENNLTTPHDIITVDDVKATIDTATDSATGLDGVK